LHIIDAKSTLATAGCVSHTNNDSNIIYAAGVIPYVEVTEEAVNIQEEVVVGNSLSNNVIFLVVVHKRSIKL
jgi:hypothetical protein